MKKTASLVIAMLLILGLLAGCAGGNAGSEQTTWEKIQAEGKVVVGLDDTFAPMGYREAGTNELVGFDIDMAAEMGERLGIEFVWQPTEWKGVTGSLNAKKFDLVINGMSITEERKKEISFSIPYVNAGIGAVVLSSNGDITDVEQLKDLSLATQTGSSGAEACKELGYENITYYDQYPQAFQDLSIGRVDAVIVDVTTAAHFMSMQPGEYSLLEDRLVEEDYAIGLRQDDKDLEEALNGVLKEMMEDGTLKAISEKWFGADIVAYQE